MKDYLSEKWLVHTVILILTQASIFGEIPDPDIFDGAIISKSNHKSDRTLESNSSNSQEEDERQNFSNSKGKTNNIDLKKNLPQNSFERSSPVPKQSSIETPSQPISSTAIDSDAFKNGDLGTKNYDPDKFANAVFEKQGRLDHSKKEGSKILTDSNYPGSYFPEDKSVSILNSVGKNEEVQVRNSSLDAKLKKKPKNWTWSWGNQKSPNYENTGSESGDVVPAGL